LKSPAFRISSKRDIEKVVDSLTEDSLVSAHTTRSKNEIILKSFDNTQTINLSKFEQYKNPGKPELDLMAENNRFPLEV
jgi:hypothetical protein